MQLQFALMKQLWTGNSVQIKETKCEPIKQNESEVDSDMILVSGYFCTSNTYQYSLKPDTCEHL